VNATIGTSDWEPIRVLVGESYSRAIAALKYYDVLLVNSIADGMNLVAKEGPIVNKRNGVLVLSERTGAQEQLGESAITISPCDVYATAEAMYQGLVMATDERKERSDRLSWIIEKEDIHDWLCRQLDAVENLIG
jgi:trehalose 6-phosphate synthase